MGSILPKQKIPKSEKNDEWKRANADYIIEQSSFWSEDRFEMINLYQASMGILDKKNYSYVLDPYSNAGENIKNYPAQMRNYDIIIPILNLFIGEKAEKPLLSTVVINNSDVPNKYKEALDNAFRSTLAQGFVNALNDAGHNTGVPSKDIPQFDDLKKEYEVNWNDKRAIFGQEAIDFIKYSLNLKDKYQEAFWDWLVVGRVYTFKDVLKNDIIHEIVPPLEMWHGTSSTGFIEDANWCLRRTRYNLNNCIDRFTDGNEGKDGGLTPEEITGLEEKFRSGNEVIAATFLTTPNVDKIASSSTNNTSVTPQGLIDIFHFSWMTFEKIGWLTYTDENGQEQIMEVDEDYKLDENNGDIKIEWDWKNQIYAGYRIGQYLYKFIEPLKAQRADVNNTSLCKQPYNGRIGYSERNRLMSIVKQLLPYQAIYNIYHFRSELTLARNKDKLLLMPMGLMPTNWAPEKFLYFAEATGIAFFDETKPNAANVLNAIKSIDLGLGTYIAEMRNLLMSIKQEAWEAVGMNRQRYGDIKASDGKGNTEQAVVKSSTISREMFRRFERFQESDLQGLLDLSKMAWINGKKGMFINSDGRRAFLNVDPEEHLSTEYDLFVLDGDSELEKLKLSKDYAFGMAQKSGEKTSTVLEMLDSNNMSKLKDIVKKIEKVHDEFEQAQQQATEAHEKQLQTQAETDKEKDRQTKLQDSTIKAKASVDVALIQAGSKSNQSSNIDDEMQEPYNEYINAIREQDAKKMSEALGTMQSSGDKRLKEAKLALEQENLKIKEKQLNKPKN